jgi:hypothetical protein
MTHTPPIPAGNQSPYPLQEPPHAKPSGPPEGAKIARTPEPQAVSVPTVIALAAGVGLAAVAGGLFWAFGGSAKPKKRGKRNGAKTAKASQA